MAHRVFTLEKQMSQQQALLARAARAVRALFSSSPYPTGPREWQDSRTGLLNQNALAELGEPLLERAERRSEPLSLLLFEFDDLVEVEALYGARARQDMLQVIGRRLRRLAGRRGLPLRLGRSSFCVLLPGATQDEALRLVSSRLGKPCSFELESGQHELVLLPRLSVSCAAGHTDSVDQLLRQCRSGSLGRTMAAYRPPAHIPAAGPALSAAGTPRTPAGTAAAAP